jgi:FtsH-binding integral membrane protein
MANWNDPQPTRTGFGVSPDLTGGAAATQVDAGLRRYMLSIYNYMASGVLLSGVVALLFAQSGMAAQMVHSPLFILVALAPLGFVLAMNFGLNRMQTSTLQALYWAFCTVMGLSLSTILLRYTGASVAATFFATAGAFAGLSLVGYTTKRNLSAMGSFLIMGVWGILIAMLLNAFVFHSGGMSLVISVLGVLIFAGLTAWDTQRLKVMYYHVAGSDMAGKVVIMGALSLYLDFINMFQFLLSFMGDRR